MLFILIAGILDIIWLIYNIYDIWNIVSKQIKVEEPYSN
jgi:hypothetical protein